MVGLNWVESTFHKRECSKFIPSNRDNARCCCGQLWQHHRDGSPATLRTGHTPEVHWSVFLHTAAFPTDAYGTVEFHGGAHPTKAQYIRLSHDTQPHLILELLTQEWGLELPKLLITVHGGKTNFDLQPKLKKVIRKGLVKTAKTTGAWVFTGGTNAGVTRHVGEALISESSPRANGSRVISVGIAPWGIVERRQELIGRNKDAPYHPVNSPKSRYAALNSHHSHFLLVDNGTSGKYGAELILRRKLENYISQQRIETRGGLATPILCVVVEGGPQTIRQVLEYITDCPPVPVIVCDGTGRAADILAFVHKFAQSGKNLVESAQETIVSTLEQVFGLQTHQAERLFEELLECAKKKDLITVFRMKDGCELDQCILSALLQAKCLSPSEQLSLALTWNRVDIARTHVFQESVEWSEGSLEQAMMDALVNNRVEFVKLLLEEGVSMKRFLTFQRLEDLYNLKQGPTNTVHYVMKDVKKSVPKDYRYTLLDIGLVINKLMGGAFRSTYTRKKFCTIYRGLRSKLVSSPVNSVYHAHSKLNCYESFSFQVPQDVIINFEFPFSELLVWAVLTKRQPLALLMWQHGEEAVAKALMAAKLYKALAHEAADDDLETEVYKELRSYAKEFEELALDVLDYCYQRDQGMAHQLLTYQLKNWSKQTCLSLAVAVNHRAFLAHPCCQILLADLWLGGLRTRKNTNLKVVLSLLFPPVVLLLDFRSKEELRSMPQTVEEHFEDEHGHYSDTESDDDSHDNNFDLRNDADLEVRVRNPSELCFPVNSTVPLCSSGQYMNSAHQTVCENKPSDLSSSVPDGHTVSPKRGSKLLQGFRVFWDPDWTELNTQTKFYEFYSAPITKYWAHAIAFPFFLCVFTYLVLVKLPPSPQWTEYYVIAYICTLLVEKMREFIASEPVQLRQKLEVWSSKLWNVFDVVFIFLFLTGLALRLQTGDLHDAGRVIYCVDIIYWYLKVLEILSAHKYLGPLVTMMGKMVKNMTYIVILLLVVLMAFGVCRQSILFPDEEPHWRLARHIFYQPYFMLYGEVFADDIDPDCGGEGEIPCHPGRWVTPTVMSVYLLVANILLINLLIAGFNNIFTSVNAISRQVWMFQRFQVVMEFEEKPVFPPPLIILSHGYRLCKYLKKRLSGKLFRDDHGLKVFLDTDSLERIYDFEEECVSDYMQEKEQKALSSTEERVKVMYERLENLSQRQDDIHTKFLASLSTFSNIDYEMKHLQEEIEQLRNTSSCVYEYMQNTVGKPSCQPRLVSPSAVSGTKCPPWSTFMEESPQPCVEDKEPDEGSIDRKLDGSGKRDSRSEQGRPFLREETYDLQQGSSTVARRETLRESVRHSIRDAMNPESEKNSEVGTLERKLSGSQRSIKKLRNRKILTASISPEEEKNGVFSFPVQSEDTDNADDDFAVIQEDRIRSRPSRKSVRRSLSESHDRNSAYTVETDNIPLLVRPRITVIPPGACPSILNLMTEYTSLGNELETVCMAQLSVENAPHLQATGHTVHPRSRQYVSESGEHLPVVEQDELRDAEELDYYLMENIVRRRLHRDSQNLAVSLEELCSIRSFVAGQEDTDDFSAHTQVGAHVDVHEKQEVSANDVFLLPEDDVQQVGSLGLASRDVHCSPLATPNMSRESSVYQSPFASSCSPSHSLHTYAVEEHKESVIPIDDTCGISDIPKSHPYTFPQADICRETDC